LRLIHCVEHLIIFILPAKPTAANPARSSNDIGTAMDERTERTMALANCSRCGALFMTQFEKHCKPCGEAILQDSHKVKSYIAAHPWASVMEVYHKTGVSLQTIYGLMERKQAAR
jgi:hypothetical protein